jgi:SAM-dependent methyltransferase
LDLGCGDGNQLSLLNIPSYIGFDVSKTAIEICKLKYRNDLSKKFFLYKKNNYQKYASEFKPDLILSLDVIYHLVEDNIFDEYIINLFNYALKYILIFSTDYDMINEAIHHRDRNFSNVILSKFPNWELVEKIYNPLKGELSSADFYFYQKIN